MICNEHEDATSKAQAEIIRLSKKAKLESLENALAGQLDAAGIKYARQYQFCSTRRWRSDFLISGTLILVEIHGGTFTHGAHVRGKRFESDCSKQNEAVLMGFAPLVFTAAMVKSGEALRVITQMVKTELYYGKALRRRNDQETRNRLDS